MIQNGSDKLLGQNSGTVPDMSDVLTNWFQPMVFTKIVKEVINFQNVETPTEVDFQGVWQPLSAQKLMMKPEGQRKWSWFQVHAYTNLQLEPDEVITYLGIQYRVMARYNYDLYGYLEYHLILDYTGSGPVPGGGPA